MITEKSTAIPDAAPPSYHIVVDGQAQAKDAYPEDRKSLAASEAPPYASSSTDRKGAPMTEFECTQSGGHVIQTKYFTPGGPMALATAVALAMWNRKPVICERCFKDLYEADLKEIWERMLASGACGEKAKHDWPTKECDGAGFYDRRCGKGKEREGGSGSGA
ncbi:hypothetical protein M408DRAFT_24952 [Serendipita vermifera MAFF 305830]|uniref:Uncharacterized protein n=1 Tax=Serendipita vermifera MAFF 305830 TaxID=933852 RepID=A0A0C3B401_SERVB|nr:hypothetical protein M408DRAFT_24952 [Serendipita vermifera MAFF 305830]